MKAVSVLGDVMAHEGQTREALNEDRWRGKNRGMMMKALKCSCSDEVRDYANTRCFGCVCCKLFVFFNYFFIFYCPRELPLLFV